MKRKLLSFLLAVFATTYFCSAQVLFDPATYSGTLPAGMSIVNIGGTDYLQVITNGWNSVLKLDAFRLAKGQKVSCEFKFAIGDTSKATGILISQINAGINIHDTVNTVPNPWGAGMVPSATVLSQGPATGTMATLSANFHATSKLIQQIQFWGQRTIAPNQWGATSYDTIWVGKISVSSLATSSLEITRETFGAATLGTGSPDGKPKSTGDTLTGWFNSGGGYVTWRWDDSTAQANLTSVNGHIETGSDSSIRTVNYMGSAAVPAEWKNPTTGVVNFMSTSGNYSGSWDTIVFKDIDITGYNVTGVAFGYAKRQSGPKQSIDTAGINVELSIDGGSWIQLDTSLIPHQLGYSTWKYINLPVADLQGSTASIRIADWYNQTFLDDLALLGVPQLIDSIVISATEDTIATEVGTVQMSAVVYPASAVQDITWSVGSPIATIDADGLLTAVSNGTVVVTATAIDGSSKTYSIVIKGQKPPKMPVAVKVFGSSDGPADYTGTVAIGWEADSVFFDIIVTDDSIVNGTAGAGNNYQVDNIEVYFDIDNSKNVHWPRNGGWVSGDMTFDDNDFQFRLVLGLAGMFDATNAEFPCSVKHELNDTGYTYSVKIAWNDMMADYSPAAGDQIGFDLLISDNDAVASDANRNQFTWVSPTDKPFNDPSLWGTLEVVEGGAFNVVPDAEVPTAPVLTGTAGDLSAILTWTPSDDNTGVMSYIIKEGIFNIDTILAKQTGNGFTRSNLQEKQYAYQVCAVDNHGNKSAWSNTAYVDVTDIVGVDVIGAAQFGIYPNPVANELNISNAATITKVEILSVNGNVISTEEYNQLKSIAINTSELASGMYFIRITTTSGQEMSKFIKK